MCVLSCFNHVWHFATLWAVAFQAPQSMEFSRQEYCSGLPWPPPGDLPDLGIKPISPASPASPALQGDSLPPSHWESPSRKFISTCYVQLLSRVWLFVTPWTATHQASLSISISQSLFRLMFIESVIPSNNFVLCRPHLFLPSANFQYLSSSFYEFAKDDHSLWSGSFNFLTVDAFICINNLPFSEVGW